MNPVIHLPSGPANQPTNQPSIKLFRKYSHALRQFLCGSNWVLSLLAAIWGLFLWRTNHLGAMMYQVSIDMLMVLFGIWGRFHPSLVDWGLMLPARANSSTCKKRFRYSKSRNAKSILVVVRCTEDYLDGKLKNHNLNICRVMRVCEKEKASEQIQQASGINHLIFSYFVRSFVRLGLFLSLAVIQDFCWCLNPQHKELSSLSFSSLETMGQRLDSLTWTEFFFCIQISWFQFRRNEEKKQNRAKL